MSSPDRGENKHIDRSVHNVDYAIWDRVRKDTVDSATFAMLATKQVMRQHDLSAGANHLSDARLSLFGALVYGRITSGPETLAADEGALSPKACSDVRDTVRVSATGLTHSTFSNRFGSPTSPGRNS